MFIQDGKYLSVIKTSYTLTLGDLEYNDLDTTGFLIFMGYTTLITLVLMNLLIAILSDAYELVTSERKFYDGKAKLQRSLMYERLKMFLMKLFKKERKLSYHYLFVSMPLSFEDDTNNEDEGMIGKILKVVRAVNKEN